MAKIATVEQLRTLYAQPMERAVKKDIGRLDPHIRKFISLSPFMVISSVGASGRTDASPRGDRAGFVACLDDKTLAIPDWPGNNRLDTLTNIIERPDVGLLFLVPGFSEQCRINGRAELLDDEALRKPFETRGKLPKAVIRVAVQEAYLHCAKAVMRARLWDASLHVERSCMPGLSSILLDQTGLGAGETDADMAQRYAKTMY